jgi:hypothetical protein
MEKTLMTFDKAVKRVYIRIIEQREPQMTDAQIKAAAEAAKAEQIANMKAARTALEAYYTGSAASAYLLHCKHGAVRKVRA